MRASTYFSVTGNYLQPLLIMTKERIRTILDFIPFAILIVSALLLIWTVITTDIRFHWKHVVGICFLPIIGRAFWYKHKIGVLTLGLTLLVGLVSLLSYSPAITTLTRWLGKTEDNMIMVFYGQPIFLLWLLIHFIVSGRHYVGVVTKKYWSELLYDETKNAAV